MCSNASKIITKPPNRGFQIRKPAKTTAEQEKALRDQLHLEIESKTKACSNTSYDCTLSRVDGHEYCLRHILQDPRAPYKQCAFVYSINGKRCVQPAPKYDLKKDAGFSNYCFEHSRLSQITKTRTAIGKLKKVETSEILLNNLSHHVKIDKLSSLALPKSSLQDDGNEIDVVTPCVNPFEIDSAAINNSVRGILDYASDSSSDDDTTTLSNTWRNHEMDNSDNESVDSQNEDLLKHAGIYTTEEATMITKEKLIRLQALYIEQFQRLQHHLKESRRDYMHNIKKEREQYCSINDQPKVLPRECRIYDKLKALNQYHKKNGIEAILYKKNIEKRSKLSENYKPQFQSKCIFTEGGVKCGERTLPSCKHCRKHILEDKKQVLFRACGVEKSGVICQEPVSYIFEDATCVLHIELPVTRGYVQKKYETDSEEDDEVSVNQQILTSSNAEASSSSLIMGTKQEHDDDDDEEMNYDDGGNNIMSDHIENELIVKTEENNDDNIDDGLNFNQHNITVDELINIEKNNIENLGNNIEIMQNTNEEDDECNVNKMAIESEIIVE